MNSWLRACGLLIGLVWTTLASAQAPTIVLVEPHSSTLQRWRAAEERLAAELTAAGFEVERQPARVADGKALLTHLAEMDRFGSVAVTQEAGQGVAYVWLGPDRGVERVVSDEPPDDTSAGTLALVVVELLNMYSLEISLPRRNRGALPADQPAPERDSAGGSLRRGSWQLGADFGPAFTLEVSRAPWAVGLGVSQGLGAFRWEALGHWMAIPGRIETSAGSVSVRGFDLRIFALWTAVDAANVSWDLGVGGGGIFLTSSVEAEPNFEAQSDATNGILLSARSRLTLWVHDRIGVLVGVEPGAILPALRVSVNGETAAVLGRPWVNTQIGLALAL